MNCDQFQERVHHLLDSRQEVADDALLLKHAQHCSTCKMQLRLWPQINDSLSGGQELADEVPEVIDAAQIELKGGSSQGSNQLGALPSTGRDWSFAQVALGGVAIAASLLFLAASNQFSEPTKPIDVSGGGEQLVQSQPLEQGVPATDTDSTHGTSNSDTLPATLVADLPSSDAGESLASSTGVTPWWNVMGEERWVRSTIPAMNSVGQSVAPLGRSMKQALTILMSQPAAGDLTPSPTGASGLDTSFKRPGIQSPMEEQTWRQHAFLLNERLA